MRGWFDRQGKLIKGTDQPDTPEWLIGMRVTDHLLGDPDYKVVARTEVGAAQVSTVWLGLDHSFRDEGPPVIFETMIFGGRLDQEQERYSTVDAAKAGHERWVAAARDAQKDDEEQVIR